ncbi:MAG: ribonuclease E inhibitor RraB [Bacteroidota bacterium]
MNRFHSDLTKLRQICFYLYFPSEANAIKAQSELIEVGYIVDISPPISSDSQWLCLASKEMTADEKELSKLRRYFSSLARKLNGNYDGWETQM